MNTYLLQLFHIQLLLFRYFGSCDSDVGIGYQVTLAIPPAYSAGFVGRAFLMETSSDEQQVVGPNFRTGLTVEAAAGAGGGEEYCCSLDIFLGNVRVWSSGHFSPFYTADKCSLELTQVGDLELKGQEGRIGWRSGTSGQGVQRLHLLRSGNLVLVDSQNSIKWQSFNFPTDIMLWGQRLSSKTRLTSFVGSNQDQEQKQKNSSLFYTLEVQYDKIALFLNSGKLRYSYWEFRPPVGEHNITYVELTSDALEIYNGEFQKVAEISSSSSSQQHQLDQPLRFLALENSSGNLGLYYYSAQKSGFQASYQALNATCDLPLACDPYGICSSFSEACSCISLVTGGAAGPGRLRRTTSGCTSIISGDLCGSSSNNQAAAAEMVELQGVTSVLRGVAVDEANVSKERCENICLQNCTCVAALHTSSSSSDSDDDEEDHRGGKRDCFLYGLARGIKEVDRSRSKSSTTTTTYMLKVPKGTDGDHRLPAARNITGLKMWVVILIAVGDGFLILTVVGGLAYYYFFRNRRNHQNSFQDTITGPHS